MRKYFSSKKKLEVNKKMEKEFRYSSSKWSRNNEEYVPAMILSR